MDEVDRMDWVDVELYARGEEDGEIMIMIKIKSYLRFND